MKILIWQARTEKGISLTELSRRTGISKGALDNYENELRSPTINQLEKIAKALGTSITNLFESPYK